MYAEFMGGGTYLRVRSIFFGDFLVFSVPFREQPGQPHHERAHPGPLGGYRLLLEWVFFRLILICTSPLLVFYFFQGRRPPEWNFTSPLCSKRNCTQPQSGLHLKKSKGLTPTRLLLLYSYFPLSLPAEWREQGSGPTPAQHQGRRRSVRWTECVTFPLGEGCACQTSFPT